MHNGNFWRALGLIGWLVCIAMALPSCSERRAPNDPNAFSAKTFWSQQERWSGGSDGGGP